MREKQAAGRNAHLVDVFSHLGEVRLVGDSHEDLPRQFLGQGAGVDGIVVTDPGLPGASRHDGGDESLGQLAVRPLHVVEGLDEAHDQVFILLRHKVGPGVDAVLVQISVHGVVTGLGAGSDIRSERQTREVRCRTGDILTNGEHYVRKNIGEI